MFFSYLTLHESHILSILGFKYSFKVSIYLALHSLQPIEFILRITLSLNPNSLNNSYDISIVSISAIYDFEPNISTPN
ncbi:hypothetical protein D3C73_1336980 [compost metagenome]